MIIDSHNHLGGPDRGDSAKQSPEEIIARMGKSGVEKAVIFPFNEINPGISFSLANDFIASAVQKYPARLIGFCRLDPTAGEKSLEELERAVNVLKLKGVKLHPMAQKFAPSNRHVLKIVEKAAELEVPVVFDSGKSIFPNSAMGELAEKCSGAKIILAHMRGEGYLEAALKNENIFLGTVKVGELERIKEAVAALGAEKIIAGSDSPYGDMKYEMIGKFEEIEELSEKEKELIRGGNIQKLLSV